MFGLVSAELGLKGKPEPDIFVTAAVNLGVSPAKAVVVEDANSGVAAGRNGGFCLGLGIARENNKQELFDHGADIVLEDMAQITIEEIQTWFNHQPHGLFESWDEINISQERKNLPGLNPCYLRTSKEVFCCDKRLVFFLDYDGTLTPIVSRPQDALLSDDMRKTVEKLSQHFTTAVVSGRMRDDVESLVGIKGIFYAGSHGFDI